MKKLITLSSLLLCATLIYAQAPQGINYQAVARNASGAVIGNKPIAVRLTIRDITNTGASLYSERDSVITNQQGLFTCIIGKGTVLSGSFNSINWGSNPKFLHVAFDPNGGTNYVAMDSSQLQSVPYALYAANGGTNFKAGTGINISSDTISNTIDSLGNLSDVSTNGASSGQVLKFNGSKWTPASSGSVTGISTGAGLTGGTITTSGTISIANGGITNAMLANSTISGVALGSNLNALNLGSGLTGTSYNGSSSVTATVDTSAGNTKIATQGFVTRQGFLTGNQTISLTGNITGSGATSINTTIAPGVVTNSMLAGSIAASKLIGTDINTVGTITSGTWNGTPVAIANGGTGAIAFNQGSVVFAGSTGLTQNNNQLFWNNANNNLGIGTNTPDISAKLDVTSTTQGFLPPRLLTTQRDAMPNLAEGLIIYNLTLHKFQGYEGNPAVLDQSQLISNASAGSPSQWQSFTAELTGVLDSVAWEISGTPLISGNPSTCYVNIYSGTGTGGSLLGTSAVVSTGTVNAFILFDLSALGINVSSGSVYTIEFLTPTVTIGFIPLSTSNPYAGGTGDNAGWDFLFKTYVGTGSWVTLN